MSSIPNKSVIPYPQPLQFILHDRKYRLARPFKYVWIEAEKLHRIVIATGFEYDGASIPRFAWSLLGLRPMGKTSAAACLHDHCYLRGGRLGSSYEVYEQSTGFWRIQQGRWSRLRADKLFATMLKEAGANKFQTTLAYQAVRLFGAGSYKG